MASLIRSVRANSVPMGDMHPVLNGVLINFYRDRNSRLARVLSNNSEKDVLPRLKMNVNLRYATNNTLK